MKASEIICAEPGCNRGPATTGHTILRTSPKGPGQPFVGKCADHYGASGRVQVAADEAAVERTLGGRAGGGTDA